MSDQSGFDTSHYYALPIGTNLFEFRIEQVLGHGGFGITYLATDTNLDERVAIKEYMPSEIAVRVSDSTVRAKTKSDNDTLEQGLNSFLEEARTIARFRHRNIVHVRRFFRLNGTAYIVLEYEYGHTLGQYLETHTINNDQLRELLSAVLNGLDVVHTRATLHRDLKPSNIILRPDESPVLIDFGAARDFQSRNSRSVTAIATAGYSPPEQYIGGQQGPWTDIYALGAIAYRIVSGTTPPDSLRRLRKDPLIPASSLDVEYDPAILRTIDWMLKIDESERPISVEAVRDSLSGAVFDTAKDTAGNQASEHKSKSASDYPSESVDLSVKTAEPRALRPALYIAGLAALMGIAIYGLNFYRDLVKQSQASAPVSFVKALAPVATPTEVAPKASANTSMSSNYAKKLFEAAYDEQKLNALLHQCKTSANCSANITSTIDLRFKTIELEKRRFQEARDPTQYSAYLAGCLACQYRDAAMTQAKKDEPSPLPNALATTSPTDPTAPANTTTSSYFADRLSEARYDEQKLNALLDQCKPASGCYLSPAINERLSIILRERRQYWAAHTPSEYSQYLFECVACIFREAAQANATRVPPAIPPAPVVDIPEPDRWNAVAFVIYRVNGRSRVAIGYSGIRSSPEEAKRSAKAACERRSDGHYCKTSHANRTGCYYIQSGVNRGRVRWASAGTPEGAQRGCQAGGYRCDGSPIGGCIN